MINKKMFSGLLRKCEIRKWINANRNKGNLIKKPRLVSDISKIGLGQNIYIGPDAYLMTKGGLRIGNNVIISANITAWTENHNYKNASLLPYDLELIEKPIVIEDNVWIGLNVSLCPGCHIGEGAVIGMGSVVRGHIPPLAIVMGNPAEIVGYRDEQHYQRLKDNKLYFKPSMRRGGNNE